VKALSLADQVAEAVALAGGQGGLARLVRSNGGRLTQPRLSELCAGQRPGVETLGEIARATGYTFTIGPETDVGHPRPERAHERGRSG
jgi:hypothetical protein